jgi:CDP-paratose 2-epimerase
LQIKPEQKQPGVSPHGINEQFMTQLPRSLYGASKLASELFVQEYGDTYRMETVINRCGVIAGPGQFGKVDQGVFTLWVANHHFKNSLAYTGFGGQGKQVRDLLHPSDLYDLLQAQLTHFDKVRGEIYNVGGGVDISTSLKELTALCEAETGHKIQIDSRLESASVDIPLYISDCHKVQNALGWKPTRTVKTIVHDIAEWLRANESQLRPLFQ